MKGLPPLILAYHSHFADALESAKKKLLEGKFSFKNLPTETNSQSWAEVSDAFKLTLAEKIALQNAVAAGTTPAFYPHY